MIEDAKEQALTTAEDGIDVASDAVKGALSESGVNLQEILGYLMDVKYIYGLAQITQDTTKAYDLWATGSQYPGREGKSFFDAGMLTGKTAMFMFFICMNNYFQNEWASANYFPSGEVPCEACFPCLVPDDQECLNLYNVCMITFEECQSEDIARQVDEQKERIAE